MLKKTLVTIFLLVCAFLIYAYKLNEVPNGVYVDEAVTGINSYSILLTGKDENGKNFPILFRFFGSYSPPLYTYLSILPIYFFGLNAESIRMISVICGILMLCVVYEFLMQEEFFKDKIVYPCLILFLITPWNYFYARTGYEIYLGFFIYSLGSLLLWKGLKRDVYIIWGISVLSLSLYGAHAQFFSAPILVILFWILFRKKINSRFFVYGILIALIIQIPRLILINTQAFLNKGDLFYSSEILNNASKIALPGFISIPLSFLFTFLAKFIYYFSPQALFLTSDPDPQRSIPELSVFYSWMIVPYLLGLAVLFLNIKKAFIKYILVLIVAAVLPASLTHDPFSSQRALPLLLPLYLIICFGISVLYKKMNNLKFNICFVVFLFFSAFLFWRSYFILLPAERASSWDFEYKQLSDEIKKNPNTDFVIEDPAGKPAYTELAFYLKTNPEVLQNAIDPKIKEDYYNKVDFNPEISFENMKFRKIVYENDIYKKQILVASELAISENQQKEHFLDEIFTIRDPRGYKILSGFMTNPEKKCKATGNASDHCQKEK